MGLQPPKDFRNSEFGIRNSEFGIRNSEFGIRNSEFRIRNSEFGIRNSEFGIVNSYGNSKVSHLGHRRNECQSNFHNLHKRNVKHIVNDIALPWVQLEK